MRPVNPIWTGAIDSDLVDPKSLIPGSLRWIFSVNKEIIKEEAISKLEDQSINTFPYGDGWEKYEWT